ncbi:hypothetical protein [Burkholderia cenocepacia]|jgi:hypothetical protein|uniref:hypothetical protein n=1 Tax=Burkholderia cenocepacia TaxID=95486 RepID=UPI0024B73445|nr:hypothetical protein [Burkholderia cenocepacia]MDI9688523.1 hypothetical protein [Burkholderia cenocepacia]
MIQPRTSGATARHPGELYFETIKARAKRIFADAVDAEAAYRGIHRGSDSPSYAALLPLIRMVATERDSLRAFVLELPPPAREDWLAQKAHWQAEQNQYHWSQQLLQVRVAGQRRIDDWDVRCLVRLIELFPGCVPRAWRHAPLSCRVAEPSGQWVVGPSATAASFNHGAGYPRS